MLGSETAQQVSSANWPSSAEECSNRVEEERSDGFGHAACRLCLILRGRRWVSLREGTAGKLVSVGGANWCANG
jgi:hypothetical protein